MPDKLQQRLTAVPLTLGRGLTSLFWEMLPPVAFFFIALMLIFVVLKLLALQYSIRFYAFARAAIGALVLGKVVLLMEMAERKRNASSTRGRSSWHSRSSYTPLQWFSLNSASDLCVHGIRAAACARVSR
jgi:hypothetical protein